MSDQLSGNADVPEIDIRGELGWLYPVDGGSPVSSVLHLTGLTFRAQPEDPAHEALRFDLDDLVGVDVVVGKEKSLKKAYLQLRRGDSTAQRCILCSAGMARDLKAQVNDSQPSKNSKTPLIIAGVAALVLASLAAAVTATAIFPAGERVRIGGEVAVATRGPFSEGDVCTGAGGYGDMHLGTTVIIKDAAGKVLGTGTFDDARWAVGSQDSGYSDSPGTCTFSWEEISVKRADFYIIETANRKGQTYSYDDLKRSDFRVALTLG